MDDFPYYSNPVKNHQGNSPNLWTTCKSWERWTRPWARTQGKFPTFSMRRSIFWLDTWHIMANHGKPIYYSNIIYIYITVLFCCEDIIEMRMKFGWIFWYFFRLPWCRMPWCAILCDSEQCSGRIPRIWQCWFQTTWILSPTASWRPKERHHKAQLDLKLKRC